MYIAGRCPANWTVQYLLLELRMEGYVLLAPQPITAVYSYSASDPGYLSLLHNEAVLILYVGGPASGDNDWLFAAVRRGDLGWIQGWIPTDAVPDDAVCVWTIFRRRWR